MAAVQCVHGVANEGYHGACQSESLMSHLLVLCEVCGCFFPSAAPVLHLALGLG